MTNTQEYKGTLTRKDHSWSSREVGQMTFRIRLDDGRLLKIERPMSSHDWLVEKHATSADASLSDIYNTQKEGIRLSLGLIFRDAQNASLTSVTLLNEPSKEARDMGWGEWLRRDFIRTTSLSPYYRVMTDSQLRRQIVHEANDFLDSCRIGNRKGPSLRK